MSAARIIKAGAVQKPTAEHTDASRNRQRASPQPAAHQDRSGVSPGGLLADDCGAMLATGLSAEERAGFAMQLQRAYGNRYVQRLVGSASSPATSATAPARAGPTVGVSRTALALNRLLVFRKPAEGNEATNAPRQNIAVIVGRPSKTIENREKPEQKQQMALWRAAGRALAPVVFEGLTVDSAFMGLKKIKDPIGTLYVIGHADESGMAEINARGDEVSTTVENLTQRLRAAVGPLGARAPISVEMMTCFGGMSPKTVARIGQAVGAGVVRAPIWMTVISGRIPNLPRGQQVSRMSEPQLIKIVQATDALKYYDFVPGVPHPQSGPPQDERIKHLARILKQVGMIPYVSYSEPPGKRNAVPYWKADVTRAKATDEMPPGELLNLNGVVEVQLPREREKPTTAQPNPSPVQRKSNPDEESRVAKAEASLQRKDTQNEPVTQETKAPARAGLASSQSTSEFAFWTAMERPVWPLLRPAQRAEAMGKVVNDRLAGIGVPECRISMKNLPTASGQFEHDVWTIAFGRDLFQQKDVSESDWLDLIDTVYHEARHAEQWFRMARMRAGMGDSVRKIASKVEIPVRIAQLAKSKPLGPLDPKTLAELEEARGWYRQEYGKGAQATEKVRIAEEKKYAVMEYKRKKYELFQKKHGISPQKLDQAYQAWQKASQKYDEALAQYWKLATEADAQWIAQDAMIEYQEEPKMPKAEELLEAIK